LGRLLIAAILLATTADAAELPPATPLVTGAGDQTAPSLSGNFLAYLGTVGGKSDIFLLTLEPVGEPSQKTTDGGLKGPPELVGLRYAFRIPNSVEIYDLMGDVQHVDIDDGGSLGQTALSDSLVAWVEATGDTGTNVGWQRFPTGPEIPPKVVLAYSGDQHSLSVAGDWLAFVDDGVAKLVNTSVSSEPRSFPVAGTAVDVSLWVDGEQARLAVLAVPTGGDGTSKVIHVLDRDDAARHWALETAGDKVNPHLYADWVGFEASTEQIAPAVTLWHFTDDGGEPWLFRPWPTGSYQLLHDFVVAEGKVRVAWADKASGADDFDIYKFEAPLADVLAPRAGGATSCETDALPIGRFTITRTTKSPTAGGSWLNLPNQAATPVLVCLEAAGVTAGWVGVGSQVVAAPGDFGQGALEREVRLTLAPGEGRAGAVIAGGPGATLSVKVYVANDGGGDGNGGSDSATCAATGECPPAPPGLSKGASGPFSCATAGGYASLAMLLLPAAALLAPRRRRSRR
jgi:hypothetical protein